MKFFFKIIVAGMFVAAMGFGMTTSLNIVENNEAITLSELLKTTDAQAENSGNSSCWGCVEVWHDRKYYRDCCGDYSSCNTCAHTGNGCAVTCTPK